MINIKDAQLINSLPSIVSNQPWAQAISYATSQMFRMILELADSTLSFCQVDRLEDDVLDILATDLRVSNYKQTYSLQIKRKLVKLALQYWATAGTKAATEDVVKTMFGDAEITEWFEYGGEPGYFRILITDTTLTDSDVLEFKRVAENVKRLSAWLDKIVLELASDPMRHRVGFFKHEFGVETVKQIRDPNKFCGFFNHTGTVEKYIIPKGDF